eukprot:1094623_1
MRKLGRDILAACQVNDVGCAPHIIHILLKNRFETERCDVALNGTNKVLTHYRKSAGSKHDLFAVKGNEQGGVIEGIPIGIKGRWGTQFKALQYMKGNGEHMKLQCVRQAFNRTLSREVKDIVLGIWEPTYWEDLDYTLTSNKPLQLTLTTLEGALVNPGCSSSTHDSVTKIFYLKGKRKVKSGWK